MIIINNKVTSPYGLETDVVYWHESINHRGFYVQIAQDNEQSSKFHGKYKAFAKHGSADLTSGWCDSYRQAKDEVFRYIDIFLRGIN